MNRKAYGFTIVELLVVIVIIGILATISVVAYNGVSNNSNDVAVKSDLSNMAKKIQMIHAETGEYPAGGRLAPSSEGSETGNNALFPGSTFAPTKSSYGAVAPASLAYCTDGRAFRILALSKSGRYFEYNSTDGLVDLGTAYVAIYGHLRLCNDFGYPRSYSYANASSPVSITGWKAWAN